MDSYEGLGASPDGDRAFVPSASSQQAVSPVPASIPSAWPLCGYAPGNYTGKCMDCGKTWFECDKRASQCLDCAARTARLVMERAKKLEQAAHLFREFVIRNATQWAMGANHHHPIWQMMAELLPGDDIRSGPDWKFILPDNRLSRDECAAQAMSAGTAKTEGLGAQPASAVPTGDAPDIAHAPTPTGEAE